MTQRPKQPAGYCDEVDSFNNFFALLSNTTIAHGACFLAVLSAKSDTIKSLIAIPFSARKKLFNREDFLYLSDMNSDSTLAKFKKIFVETECDTIECPEAILAYYGKTTDSFSRGERVWAFWVNDFARTPRITFVEHVAGSDAELSDSVIDEILERYIAKFNSLYRLQATKEDILDFKKEKGYYISGNYADAMSYVRALFGDLDREERINVQRSAVNRFRKPIQIQHIPLLCSMQMLCNRLNRRSAAPKCYLSQLMSYARCLYYAFSTYFDDNCGDLGYYGNAGATILQEIHHGHIHCPDADKILDKDTVEKWIDASMMLYCFRIACNVFAPNGNTSKINNLAFHSTPEFSCSYITDRTVLSVANCQLGNKCIPFYDDDELKVLHFNGRNCSIQHISRP